MAVPEKIAFNYEELKQELSDKVKMYETLVYTDDQMKSAKADRAGLNRLDKALNDERISWEKEYMKPFNLFKGQIDELRGIIKKASSAVDKQIKACEEQQRQEKKQRIEEIFTTNPHPEWLKLPQIWDDKWLNASVSMKSIQAEIDSRIAAVESDLATLSTLPEFSFEAVETYKTTLDLNKSIAEGHRLSEMQKRKAEQERIKAEQEKARAEQEQLGKAQENRTSITPEQDEFIPPEVNGEFDKKVWDSPKQWVSFSALLNTEDARALADFFKSRNIEFKRI